ncbi:MAG TPA: hypothetical protein DCG87_05395 [Synergistaceae bacterium]|nr:hypothetical protein [Synergistaceae bacterium]
MDTAMSLVTKEELIKIVSDLIRIESHKFVEGEEREIALHIQKILEKEGVRNELVEVEEGRYNIYGFLPGEEEHYLMFNGHIDTVPPFDMTIPPFDPVIKGDLLYGRGSVDMKSAVGAMLATIIALKRGDYRLQKGLVFAGVIDEEKSCKGTEHIVRNGPVPKVAIIGEPTDLYVSIAHKGMEWIEVSFTGKAAHGSRPKEGINAIYLATEFIRLIREELEPALEKRAHFLVGAPTINVGVIKGGDDPNIVADKCVVQLDRRWTPDETIEGITEEIGEIAALVTDNNSRGSYSIKGMREHTAALLNKPFIIDKENPLVQKALEEVTRIVGEEREPRGFPAWSDAGQLSNERGVDCIVLGPGSIEKAHSNDEYVPLDQVFQAYQIYFNLALKICEGRKGSKSC